MAENTIGLTAGQGALYGGAIATAGNLVGGIMNAVIGSKQADKDWQRNYDAQKEFAQNSIQWRVQDAQKAGIHPLYAMGNTPGYTPSSSFNSENIGTAVARASNAFGDTMGQLGMINAYLQNEKLSNENEKTKIDLEQSRQKLMNNQLDIYNRLLANAQGQVPSTIPMPWITKPTENTHMMSAGGYGRNLPDQMESELASLPADVAKVVDTMYNKSSVDNLPPPAKGMRRIKFLSPLGFSHRDVPANMPNSELGYWDNVNRVWYNWYDTASSGIKRALKWFYNE